MMAVEQRRGPLRRPSPATMSRRWRRNIRFEKEISAQATARDTSEEREREGLPGYAGFQAADALINGRSKGGSHGNNPEAQALAESFAARLKAARKFGIESRKSSSVITLTGGEFITYCLLTPNRCVFLVHVPDLRKFSSDAKNFIVDAGWATAVAITEPRKQNLQTVTVGVRGALLYERMLSGSPFSLENPTPFQVEGSSDCKAYLQRFFVSQDSAASSSSAP